jgi:Uma2 family endonuclease
MAMARHPTVLDASVDGSRCSYEREDPIPVDEAEYVRIALADPDTVWELHDGVVVEKPGMSFQHQDLSFYLGHQLAQQLDRAQFRVRVNGGRLRRSGKAYFVPDVIVIPTVILGPEIYRPDVLEVYDVPLPFVAEVWSPTTGTYDIDTKLPEYRKRGDLEIWRLQPFERTLTMWRRQPDGSYDETTVTGGTVQLLALPAVTVDLDALFV